MISKDKLEEELRNIVNDLGFRDATTEVEQPGRWFHVVIATKDFEGKTAGERENVIWREFEERFDDETILSITQCYLLTPEEYEASFSHEPALTT